MIKKTLKKYFPFTLYVGVFQSFIHSFFKYVKFSGVVKENSSSKLISKIIADYHVVEKGLTMPETRLGFGKDRVLQLISYCNKFIEMYGENEEQLQQAISVILEYKLFHEVNNFSLDKELINKINELQRIGGNLKPTIQKSFTLEDYFNKTDASFPEFSESRLSVRNYSSKVIPIEILKNAVELANHAPSSCNRQTVRVNIYTDKEVINKILEIQGGNRGFGHLTDKLIILTSDLAFWHGVYERTGPYVDGGIYAMNLLYALHYNKIGACPLNCNLSPSKDKKLREICKIPKNEVFVVMISCGYPPDNFKAPISKRYSSNSIIRVN